MTKLVRTGFFGVQVQFNLSCFKRIAEESGYMVRVETDNDFMLLDMEGSETGTVDAGDWIVWQEDDNNCRVFHSVLTAAEFKDGYAKAK